MMRLPEMLVLLFLMVLATEDVGATRLESDGIQSVVREIMRETQRNPLLEQQFSLYNSENATNVKSCRCQGDTCGCCVHMQVDKIHLNDDVCFNVSYLPKEIGVEVALILNGKVLIQEKVSVRNPPPICIGIPYLEKYASLCLRLYNLDFFSDQLSGCAEIEARLFKLVLMKVDVGCFKIPEENKYKTTKTRKLSTQ